VVSLLNMERASPHLQNVQTPCVKINYGTKCSVSTEAKHS